MRLLNRLLFSFFAMGCSQLSLADKDESRDPEISIIQERIFDKKHEIGLSLGHLPDDNFYEVYPFTFNYTYHFNERFAWEVIRASYMLTSERDIKKDLEENFGVTPSTFEEITNHFETSFVLKPTYGKDSVWNKRVINHEGFMTFGAGVATFNKHLSFGETEQKTVFAMSAGIGRKYFLSRSVNVSFELKDIVMFKDSGVENFVYIGMGLNFRFNAFGSGKKSRDDNSSIYEYLK